MSDTTDEMEADAGKLFCQTCGKHFEECECEQSKQRWEITKLI